MRELREGICGYHSGARTMTNIILRAGYFWPNMEADYHTFVKNMVTSFIKSKNNSIPYSPRGLLQSGEWTSSTPSPREKDK